MLQGTIGRRSRAFCHTNAVMVDAYSAFQFFSLEAAKGTMQDDTLDRFFPTKNLSLGTLNGIYIVNARPTFREFLRPRFRNGPCSGDRKGSRNLETSIVHPRCRKARSAEKSRTFPHTNAVMIRFSIFLLEPAKGTMQDDTLDRFFPTKNRSLGTLSCISIVNARPTFREFLRPRFRNGPCSGDRRGSRSLKLR